MPDSPEKKILNQMFQEENQKYDITLEKEPEVDKKVEDLVRNVEKEIYLTKPITDNAGQPIVSSTVESSPKIVLPVTKSVFDFGLKQKVEDSVRWLAVWCQKLIKMFGSRTVFREEKQTA